MALQQGIRDIVRGAYVQVRGIRDLCANLADDVGDMAASELPGMEAMHERLIALDKELGHMRAELERLSNSK